MSKKASSDLLEELHALVTKEFLTRLRSGEATAAELSVMVKFLKDNNIQAIAGEADMTELQRTLADLGAIPVAGEVPEEFKH